VPVLARFWLCLPLLLAPACAFDTRGLGRIDAAAGDGVVATDGSTSDGAADAHADSGHGDAAPPADQGAGDAGDAGGEGDGGGGDAPCAAQCSGKLCGASNGCGGTCQPGSGCCSPSCSGHRCGDGDGCGGTCQPGSGCCTPACDAPVCGGHDGCGGICHGNHGDPCTAPAESWRCVWIDQWGAWGAQVCRSGTWQTYTLGPHSCQGCCGATFSPDCCPSAGCPD